VIDDFGLACQCLRERLNSRAPTALSLLTASGKFGVKTQSRVQEFQVHNALLIDGIVPTRHPYDGKKRPVSHRTATTRAKATSSGVTMEMKIVRTISVLYGQVLIALSSCLLIANAFSSVATA
jgi:hypothetical protein